MSTAQLVIIVTRALVLFVLLIVAAFTDVAYGKIYNWLVYPAIVLGLVLGVLGQAVNAGRPDVVDSAAGLAAGAALFGFFFLRGWMGGADVKLAAAIGAIGGLSFFLVSLIYITLAGCIIAVTMLIWRGRFIESVVNSIVFFFRPAKLKKAMEESGKQAVMIPYGLAMAVGTMVAWYTWYTHYL
ncbi:MAG TPA: A24 family peptidase [Planctomycetota bacterium]|nr:A24 family peptidase [Planctomycetota bacterium]